MIGCLPDQLGFQPINVLSTLGATLGSKQGMTALLNTSFGVPFATAQALGNALGLFQLAGNGGAGRSGRSGRRGLPRRDADSQPVLGPDTASVAAVPGRSLPDATRSR